MKRKFRIDFGKANDHSIDYLLGILEDARVTTLQRIENMSVEELDWQYSEGWNTIGVLLSHIIGIEHYFRIYYVEGRTFTKEEHDRWMSGVKMGTYIPGIRPGQQTVDYLDYVLTRLTAVGALYLASICVLPELILARVSLPFYFGGTSLLIVVSVTIDTISQIQSHLVAHQYEGLIKKSKLKGK